MTYHRPLGTVGQLLKRARVATSRPVRQRVYVPTPVNLFTIEDQIFALEGVRVRFRGQNHLRPEGSYPYKARLGNNFALLTFHKRIVKHLPDIPYDIIDGYGHKVTASHLTMSALRSTY